MTLLVNGKREMCPFCPLLVEESMWNRVGNDFFGEPATIGGIPACGDCYEVAQATDPEQMVKALREFQQAQQA